jgi:Rap1a immunity proteins
MKHLWLLALLLSLLSPPLSSQAPDLPETSGSAFLRLCSVADKENKTSTDYGQMLGCGGYVAGFGHGVAYEKKFAEAKTGRKVPAPYCLPDTVEDGQVIHVVLKYIRDNPADANEPTAALIMDALAKSYPCPSK